MLNPPRRDNIPTAVRSTLGRHIELVVFVLGIAVGYILCRL